MDAFKIKISEEISQKIQAGILQISGLSCRKVHPALWKEMEELGRRYQNRFADTSAALEALQPARRLYYSMGMEPTRIRPSSEALLRRVLKGKPLYQVNSIVDVCNYCSLSFLLPVGLYDIQKISGEVTLRLGKPGEAYTGIGKDEVYLGGRLTLADEEGPFGNPSSDSSRTAIDLSTTNILAVIFAPGEYPPEKLKDHLQFFSETMLRFHSGARMVQQTVAGYE
ncbi:MAG: phenylalanine--tRNA ligase beta subunit-related protein [Calditrichia bacterium]